MNVNKEPRSPTQAGKQRTHLLVSSLERTNAPFGAESSFSIGGGFFFSFFPLKCLTRFPLVSFLLKVFRFETVNK